MPKSASDILAHVEGRKGPFPASPVHRHRRHHQERRGPRKPVRKGPRRPDHVRRLVHRGLHPHRGVGHAAGTRPRHLPGLSVGGQPGQGRPADLRHRQPRRHTVRRLPARRAQEGRGQGQGDGLQDDGRSRGRVLPLSARRRTAPRSQRPTTPAATSISAHAISARRRGATSPSCSRPWVSRSRPPTTRWLPASTRSTSSTATPWPPPTRSSPSASWSRRSP